MGINGLMQYTAETYRARIHRSCHQIQLCSSSSYGKTLTFRFDV